MKIPVYMLSAYEYCSRKLFLEKVANMGRVRPEKSIMLDIEHDTLHKINTKQVLAIKSIDRSVPFEDLAELLKREFGKSLRNSVEKRKDELKELGLSVPKVFKSLWPRIVIESTDRAKAVYEFKENEEVVGEELWQGLRPKIMSNVSLESIDLGLAGVVDQVRYYDDKITAIVHKKGLTPKTGVWPSHRLQLASYLIILKKMYENRKVDGFIRYIDGAQMRRVSLNPFMKHEVKSVREKVIKLLQSPQLPPKTTNLNKCAACPLKEDCYDEGIMNKVVSDLKEKGKL